MRLLLALFLLPAFAGAQKVTWVNIAGPWHFMRGDDLRYADVALDDSGWQILNMPLGSHRGPSPRGQFWIRRSVELTEEPGPEPLSITVGPLAEAYEVYVNGELVGATGAFDLASAEIRRPRTFELPPSLVRRKLVIAIRAWRPSGSGTASSGAWSDLTAGPWLLTSRSAAPVFAGPLFIAAQKLSNGLDAAQAPVLFLFAGIALLIWLRETKQMEMLWLFLFLLDQAINRVYSFVGIGLHTHPFAWAAAPGRFAFVLLPASFLALFAASAFGVGRMIWPVAVVTLAGVVAITSSGPALIWAVWALQAMTVLISVFALLDRSAGARWTGTSRSIVVAGICIALYFHGNRYANWGFRISNTVRIWDYTLSVQPFLVSLLGLAFAIATLRRLLAEREQRIRLSNDLAAAGIVQQLLLNTNAGTYAGYEVEAEYQPAQDVGGDFYWTQHTAGGGMLCAIGDVSGKGLKAAMVVSLLIGAMRNRKAEAPGQLLAELNRALSGVLPGGFVTAAVASCDAAGCVTLASAGHPAPFVAGAELGIESGLPLGVLPDAGYPETCFTIAAGQQLTFVSDGVLEAANGSGELFGFERTARFATQSATEVAGAACAWGQNDDITVVTVRRVAA